MAGDDEGMSAKERLFWEAVRRALLMLVHAIEERIGVDEDSRSRKPGAKAL